MEEGANRTSIEASRSADVVREMLLNVPYDHPDPMKAPNVESTAFGGYKDISKSHSIFLLETTYAHTLNQILFHSQEAVAHANVKTCVCPSFENRDKSVAGAKMRIKDLSLFGPMSLKDDNSYMVLEYCRCLEGGDSFWELTSTEFCTL